jgi:hypothetical protein
MASNLYEYYQSIGQNLPSIQERAKIFETSGLGSATGYMGTASQNAALLAKLASGGSVMPQATPQTVAQTTPQTTQQVTTQPTAQTGGYDINAIVNAMLQKGYNNRAEAEAVAKGDPERFAREYLGVGGTTGATGATITQQPTIDLTSIYDNLTNKAGINDLQNQLVQREQAYNLAVSKINDNPYLSEATRVGRIQKLTTDYQNSVKPLQAQIEMATSDVKNRLGMATQQYEYGVQARETALNQFNSLLSSGALVGADASTIAQLAASTGISSSIIQSAITASGKKDVNIQVIKSEDDNGNVVVSVINTDTGDVIKQTSLGQVGTKTKVPSGGGVTPTKVSEQQFLEEAKTVTGQQTDTGWVGQFPLLVAKYAPYFTLSKIYQLYSQSELGQKYGNPTEDATEIKELYNYYRGNE